MAATRTKTSDKDMEKVMAVEETAQDNATDTERMTAILCRPFPSSEIKTRKGGGGKDLSYVTGASVIRRLIEATGNNYSTEVTKEEFLTIGGKPAMLVVVRLTIPNMGYKEGYGVQILQGGEDMYKGAFTDGLKKAATQFGVGLDLYFDEEEPAPPPTPSIVTTITSELKEALRANGVNTVGKLTTALTEKFGVGIVPTPEEQAAWAEELAKPQTPDF
jgi:hypothetical protein